MTEEKTLRDEFALEIYKLSMSNKDIRKLWIEVSDRTGETRVECFWEIAYRQADDALRIRQLTKD